MGPTFADRIGDAMSSGNPWLLPLAFVGGLATSLNPCAYPMTGAVAGYVWAQGQASVGRKLAVASMFLLGLVLIYTTLGVAGAMVGPLLGLSRTAWSWLLAIIFIVAGAALAELVPIPMPSFSPLAKFWPKLSGLPGALAMGILLGLVATPCATPPLAAILTAAASQQMIGLAALLLVAYALGHGLPAVLVGVLAGSLTCLERFKPYGHAFQLAGGWLLILVGVVVLYQA